MRRRAFRNCGFYLGVVCLSLSLSLAGCGNDRREDEIPGAGQAAGREESGGPVTGDWLIFHSLSDPEQLNPVTSNDSASSEILQYIFQSMLTRDPRGLELKPLLAESRPVISPDKRTYTFRIRRDVRFQDGRPLTGEDVLFSLKVIKCPLVNAPFLRVYFDSVADAELVDRFTIRFHTREPYFLNESVLGSIDVLPRHYYDPQNLLERVSIRDLNQDPSALSDDVRRFADDFNKNFTRRPMGSGPYKFHQWKTGQEIELARDADYWGNGKAGIDQPYLDRYKFRIINNMDAALVTLKSGGLDAMNLTPIQHVRGTSSGRFKREFRKYEYFSPSYTYLGWNNDHPIFRDPRVRRAMTYFTDRKQMVETILFGLGEVVDSPIYFFRPEYDKDLAGYPYDPQRGTELLRQAGWSDSDGDGVLDKRIDGRRVAFRFEIKINSGNTTRKSVALILQDELKKHGIFATVRELDWTIFLDDVRSRKFDVVILGWSMGLGEPDAYQVWHSSQVANRGSNFIGYKNARVDRILEVYRGEFDEKKRIELYREFQRILSEEQPYTFLFIGKSVSAVQRRFRGVEVLPVGLRTIDWWVPGALRKYPRKIAER